MQPSQQHVAPCVKGVLGSVLGLPVEVTQLEVILFVRLHRGYTLFVKFIIQIGWGFISSKKLVSLSDACIAVISNFMEQRYMSRLIYILIRVSIFESQTVLEEI